jgi:putative ABC transport system permease protein
MMHIGLQNLKRDPMRVTVAIAGIVFSVVLVTLEVGLLSGLMRNASLMIDSSRADLWISAKDTPTIDFSTPFGARSKYRIEAVPGVEKVEDFSLSFSAWKLPNGTFMNVQIAGLDVHGDLRPSINLVEGSISDLALQDAIIIDRGDQAKLGNPQLGDIVDIYNHRAKVVGFTEHMKSFTTSPYVFTSQKNFHTFSLMGREDKPISLLVKVKDGESVSKVRDAIAAAVTGIEVQTREGFSSRTRNYWLIETGMGIGFLAAALLGLLVGGVIVSQTLYAMTVEKVPEFAVLKAMGASMAELAFVVLEQGFICGGIGVALGLAASKILAAMALRAGTSIELSTPLIILVAILTLALCSAASLASVLRLRKIEPAMVFRA